LLDAGGCGYVDRAMETEPRESENQEEQAPENAPGEPGAEGGKSSPDADSLPGAPTEDDSEVGDTDQHSSA
jgi:hypothetical protein